MIYDGQFPTTTDDLDWLGGTPILGTPRWDSLKELICTCLNASAIRLSQVVRFKSWKPHCHRNSFAQMQSPSQQRTRQDSDYLISIGSPNGQVRSVYCFPCFTEFHPSTEDSSATRFLSCRVQPIDRCRARFFKLRTTPVRSSPSLVGDGQGRWSFQTNGPTAKP